MSLPLTHDGIPTSCDHKLWIRELYDKEMQRLQVMRESYGADVLFDDAIVEEGGQDENRMTLTTAMDTNEVGGVIGRESDVVPGLSTANEDWMMEFVDQSTTGSNNNSSNSLQSISSAHMQVTSGQQSESDFAQSGEDAADDDDIWMKHSEEEKAEQSHTWKHQQKNQKNMREKTKSINFTNMDVLFGRGKGSQNHPGNVRFHRLLDQHIDEYDRASKLGKTALSEKMIKIINQSSGRFLKQDENKGGELEEVDLITAREKVSRAFRARRRLLKNATPGCPQDD